MGTDIDLNAMPALEWLLQEHLAKNIDRFKQRATDPVWQAYPERFKRANAVFSGKKP